MSKYILISTVYNTVTQDTQIDFNTNTLEDMIVEFINKRVIPYSDIDIDDLESYSIVDIINYFEIEFEGINSDIKHSLYVLDDATKGYIKLSKQMIREYMKINAEKIMKRIR